MIFLKTQKLDTIGDLKTALHKAMQLEHATIPPYLTAYFTLKSNNESARHAKRLIASIFEEEMLHMTIVGNILNAMGETPKIANKEFITKYPGTLPMGIGDDDGVAPGEPLIVGIKKYSKNTVERVFMAIEEPEVVHAVPTTLGAAPPSDDPQPSFQTIGQFYAAIKEKIVMEGEDLFADVDRSRQVTRYFGEDLLFHIDSVEAACNAIDIIVEQGEGTPERPIDLEGNVPHFYQFQSLMKGYKAVVMPVSEENPVGLKFDQSQPITIDEELDVVQMVDNPQLVDLTAPEHKRMLELSDKFSEIYSDVLDGLQKSFDGNPNQLGLTIFEMHRLSGAARDLLQEKFEVGPHAGLHPGPRFEYVGT